MKNKEEVYNFANKWKNKFLDEKTNYLEIVDQDFADDCKKLGFKMDCGQSFSKKYGNASHDFKELEKVIDNINSVSLLGSAIYSQWRYFNHWAYSCTEVLEEKNKKWFILALNRLETLSKK